MPIPLPLKYLSDERERVGTGAVRVDCEDVPCDETSIC